MSDEKPIKKSFKDMVDEAGFDLIGQRIRRIREHRKMTIRDLAEISEVSKNTLVRLEQGLPTHVSTIKEVCKALKLKANELVGDHFPQPAIMAVHRSSDDHWYDMNTFETVLVSPPLTQEEIVAAPNRPKVTLFQHLVSRFEDGSFNPHIFLLEHPTSFRSHRGEEFAIVLEGAMDVRFKARTVTLQKGESIMFWAAEKHCYEPIGDVRPVRILSIIIDPFPGLSTAETKEFHAYMENLRRRNGEIESFDEISEQETTGQND
jgi:transcriptional regulator with XRE-family HTH domain